MWIHVRAVLRIRILAWAIRRRRLYFKCSFDSFGLNQFVRPFIVLVVKCFPFDLEVVFNCDVRLEHLVCRFCFANTTLVVLCDFNYVLVDRKYFGFLNRFDLFRTGKGWIWFFQHDPSWLQTIPPFFNNINAIFIIKPKLEHTFRPVVSIRFRIVLFSWLNFSWGVLVH